MDGFWGVMIFAMALLWFSLIMLIWGGPSSVEYPTDNVPSHTYTEQEYITLYNYCVSKRNAKAKEYYARTQNKSIIKNMDRILDYCSQKYHNPYQTKCNYTDLCLKLLSLFPPKEQEEINFGILKN